jgi:hypothetical protein
MAHSPKADQKGCALYQSTHGLWPLLQLQPMQQATRFDGVVVPPCAFGMT